LRGRKGEELHLTARKLPTTSSPLNIWSQSRNAVARTRSWQMVSEPM